MEEAKRKVMGDCVLDQNWLTVTTLMKSFWQPAALLR